MTDAPKRIWAWCLDGNVGHATKEGRIGKIGDNPEYHLARPGQPCNTDEFLDRLQASDLDPCQWHEAICDWTRGDFTAAMEGLMTAQDKTPIRALIEAVEAGEVRPYVIEEMSAPIFHHFVWPKMGPAYSGSLDAALALHEALLPGWEYELNGSIAHVKVKGHRHTYTHDAQNGYTARAWLLAILKAYEAQQ